MPNNLVTVDGVLGAILDFTPPSAIQFDAPMHLGTNNKQDAHMNVKSNQSWQITVQGLAPTANGSTTDGKMTKWAAPVAPATDGTYYPPSN